MNLIQAAAGFPNGMDGADGYVPLTAVNDCLVGKRIVAVEYTNHNTVKFLFDDGASVSLTPSGIEGDDLDLSIEPATSSGA